MLDIINIIDVSVSEAPVGLGEFNMNNLALFTDETPLDGGYGDYQAFVSAQAVAEAFGNTSETYQQAVAIFSQQPNILAPGGNLIIIPIGYAETLSAAITRASALVFFYGILSTIYPTGSDRKDLADDVEAMSLKMLFLPSETLADIAGVFTDIKEAADYHTRCLYYETTALDARLFASAYAGRALSVNFDGSNTTISMHLKQLKTILADDSLTQTILNQAVAAGVDVYGDFGGVARTFTSTENKAFDSVYNLDWFVADLRVAGFNALATLRNKLPQTEPGMSVLKDVVRNVCEQAVANAFVAPGSWTSPETFGNQEDFLTNILQRGYYIYSAPVALQSAADREDRKAPLIQVALKEAGAIHKGFIVVNVNP